MFFWWLGNICESLMNFSTYACIMFSRLAYRAKQYMYLKTYMLNMYNCRYIPYATFTDFWGDITFETSVCWIEANRKKVSKKGERKQRTHFWSIFILTFIEQQCSHKFGKCVYDENKNGNMKNDFVPTLDFHIWNTVMVCDKHSVPTKRHINSGNNIYSITLKPRWI